MNEEKMLSMELDKDDVVKMDCFVRTIRQAWKEEEKCWTWIVDLETINRVSYAIVIAYMDYDNIGDWRLYAKVAYKSVFSIMDDYDIDWTMPYNKKTGEIAFDEIEITNSASECFKTLYAQWKVIRFLIKQGYKEIEFGQKTRKVEV